MALNPHEFIVSGDKALLVNFEDSGAYQVTVLSERTEDPLKQEPAKKKSQKYSQYIAQCLVNEDSQYYVLVNNYHKLVLILKRRAAPVEGARHKAEDFFKVEHS